MKTRVECLEEYGSDYFAFYFYGLTDVIPNGCDLATKRDAAKITDKRVKHCKWRCFNDEYGRNGRILQKYEKFIQR